VSTRGTNLRAAAAKKYCTILGLIQMPYLVMIRKVEK